MKLDDHDLQILRILVINGNLSSRKIAKEVGVSPSTVTSRVKRLRKEGVIIGNSARLNYEKLGYGLTVVTRVIMYKDKITETGSAIAKIPNVCCVYYITGQADAIVIAKFQNRTELNEFTKKILALRFVAKTETQVVLSTVKEDFRII